MRRSLIALALLPLLGDPAAGQQPRPAPPGGAAQPARVGLGLPIVAFPDRFNEVATRLELPMRAKTEDCPPPPARPGRFRVCVFQIGEALTVIAAATADHETLRSLDIFLEAKQASPRSTVEFVATFGVLLHLLEPKASEQERRAVHRAVMAPQGAGLYEGRLRDTDFQRSMMPGVRTTITARRAGDRDD